MANLQSSSKCRKQTTLQKIGTPVFFWSILAEIYFWPKFTGSTDVRPTLNLAAIYQKENQGEKLTRKPGGKY